MPVQEIRDGFVVLRDGSLRAIVMTSTINFALKSEDERAAIISQFQAFLNSLDFSAQIFIQSRRFDVKPYLALLEQRLKDQTNDLMRIQIQEYITFIRSFTESTSIMQKNFYVVIPYTPAILDTKKGLLGLFKKPSESEREEERRKFEEHRTQLEQRIAVVAQGLARCGIRVFQLGTSEVVELYYKLFNPGDTERPTPVT